LELLKRRGKFRPEVFVGERPADEPGCLYYSVKLKNFITPGLKDRRGKDYKLHFGGPGGIVPLIG